MSMTEPPVPHEPPVLNRQPHIRVAKSSYGGGLLRKLNASIPSNWYQTIGHQRGPACLQVEQLRGGMLGKQPGQRAEGLAACGLAGAAVNPWADQGDGAESGAEQKAAAALEVPTTPLAAPVPCQETRRLGCNEVYLRTGQHGLRLVKRQADLLELVIALVEAGNHVLAISSSWSSPLSKQAITSSLSTVSSSL